MISPESGIHRPSNNGAPAIQTFALSHCKLRITDCAFSSANFCARVIGLAFQRARKEKDSWEAEERTALLQSEQAARLAAAEARAAEELGAQESGEA